MKQVHIFFKCSFPPISSNLISNQSKLWYARIGVCPSQEEEHSKLKESNRQLVAVAKGLAGALLVVGVGPILAIISKHRKHCFQVNCLGGKCRASMISDIWNQEKTQLSGCCCRVKIMEWWGTRRLDNPHCRCQHCHWGKTDSRNSWKIPLVIHMLN